MQFPQFLADVTTENVAQFANVTANEMRRAEMQRYDDGHLAVTLRVFICANEVTNPSYYIELACTPHTQPALHRAWQHVARPARARFTVAAVEARVIHGRALELIRLLFDAADDIIAHTVPHIPAKHEWHHRALPAEFVTPAELAQNIACDAAFNV